MQRLFYFIFLSLIKNKKISLYNKIFFSSVLHNNIGKLKLIPKSCNKKISKKQKGKQRIMLEWPIIKQIISMFTAILNLVFEGLNSVGVINVGIALIIFSFFAQLFLLPFGIRSGLQDRKNRKKKEMLDELAKNYKDKMQDAEALEEYKRKQAEINERGKKPKKGTGCLIVLLQLFIIFCILSSISLITTKVNVIQGLSDEMMKEAYTFLGMNLLEMGITFTSSLIIPIAYILICFMPSRIRSYKAQKREKEKIKEEMTEEELKAVEKDVVKPDPLTIVMKVIGILPLFLIAYFALRVPRFYVLFWMANSLWKTAQLFVASIIYKKVVLVIKEKIKENKEKKIEGDVDIERKDA